MSTIAILASPPVLGLGLLIRGCLIGMLPGLITRNPILIGIGAIGGGFIDGATIAAFDWADFRWNSRGPHSDVLEVFWPPPIVVYRIPNGRPWDFEEVFIISRLAWVLAMLALWQLLLIRNLQWVHRVGVIASSAIPAAAIFILLAFAVPMLGNHGRVFRPGWPHGITITLLVVSWPIIFIAPSMIVAHGSHVRIRSGYCLKCGYDLRGSPGPTCPECGTPFDRDSTQTTKHTQDHQYES